MKKKCFKCKNVKDIEQFYVHKQMGDGHLGKCKSCTKKDVKERYNDPESRKRIDEYEKKRSKDSERRKYRVEINRKINKLHKGKYKARNKVNDAVRRKKIIRGVCKKCGYRDTQAHHKDYRRPLDIIWLCAEHHRLIHKKT